VHALRSTLRACRVRASQVQSALGRRARACSSRRRQRDAVVRAPQCPRRHLSRLGCAPFGSVPRCVSIYKFYCCLTRFQSHDRGARSDSEAANRPRRPSVSLRRTRISMFGPPRTLEPHPSEEIARLAARPWYLQPAHSPATGDIVIDPDGSIRAGTLEAITERLTCDPPSTS
jgi:hypothetical protein